MKPSEDTVVPEKKLAAASAVDTGIESNTSLYVTLIVISAAAVAVIARIAMMRNVEAEQEIEDESSDSEKDAPKV